MPENSSNDEERQALLDAAGRFIGAASAEVAVVIIHGRFEVVQPLLGIAVPGQAPEGLSSYDAAIVRSIGDRPLSASRLARQAGHRHNSYFRERLAALVEQGHIRHTRRGYFRPGE